jgi:hypothetical protein
VSIALIESEMKLMAHFLVQTGKHAGKGFIASARRLKEFLEDPKIWGPADETIPGTSSRAEVEGRMRGRNGVYIMLGEGSEGVKDHATLWLGGKKDVVGGGDKSQIGKGGTIYFWELKGELVVKEEQITKAYWSYGDKYTPLEKCVEIEDDLVWKSIYYDDVNLYVETEEGNDGKIIELALESNDGQKIELRGTVFSNKVVFAKIFEKYMSN